MIAKEGYIVRFLDGADKKFVIPVYQRPYSWKKSNCELLIKDLKDVIKYGYPSHFFGSIVYVENDVGGCNEYLIIDGQQRLTTVSLLLLAIRNYIVDHKISNGINTDKITEAYLTDKYSHGQKKLKLKLIQGDDDAYDRLIENTQPLANNNVTVNYNYFYNVISELSSEQIKCLYDAIMKLMIVNISLHPHNGDDPQLIFESLNSTGLDLEEADKIRNFVLMKLSYADQNRIYKNYWEKLEEKVSKEDINKFIRYYLAIKNRELTNENKLYFAFKFYKEHSGLAIEDLLKDMLIYAEFYNLIKSSKISDSSYLGSIARIKKLEINTVIPLLFDLFSAQTNNIINDEDISLALKIIESYITRRMISNLPTSALNKIFVSIGAEIEKYIQKYHISYIEALKYAILSKTGKSRFPTDHEFEEKFLTYELYNAKPSAKKFIFERLENYNNKERVDVDSQIDNGELTIEHIMPQTLTEEWRNELGNNWELIHNKYLNTLGNLTLTAYNSDYSNLSFIKKKNMAEKGFLCSKLSLNSFIKTCDSWREDQIKQRAKKLLDIAKQIWYTPTTTFKPEIYEAWITLDEDLDFTNKIIIKFNILGDEILCSNITDAYKKINEILYTLDPVRFANLNSIYQSTTPLNLREPYEINHNMFIETNLNSQRKISILRDLFTYFEIDFQDLKFLIREKSQNETCFNLEDETTYDCIKVGELAYQIFCFLLQNNKLTNNEIESLTSKEYTNSIFNAKYPALSYSRDTNKGNSKTFRYYKQPINVNGKNVYISSQWYDNNRNNLINYFKKLKQ